MTTPSEPVPVWFHPDQLQFKPRYEWAFGERIDHPETTARAESIVEALRDAPGFAFHRPEPPRPATLRRTHAVDLLTLYEASAHLDSDLYPTVFPKGDMVRADPHNVLHAGYWCFDAGTPLNARTWKAARWSAAAALAAAGAIEAGAPLAYSLSRPPGHHATRSRFGGYCYLNNAALAARRLARRGRVAVLDIDYHHGNGTQSIFWRSDRVLTVSLHGDPRADFPYFAGFAEERGVGRGEGFNLNLPLPLGCDGPGWLEVLVDRALPALRAFAPAAVVLAAGLDAYHRDPIGKFTLETEDFRTAGERIGREGWPVVAVQEGGYYTPDLGRNARALLEGLRAGLARARGARIGPGG
jgi:acetoin utilization deacetylase AcuC-like enzyme